MRRQALLSGILLLGVTLGLAQMGTFPSASSMGDLGDHSARSFELVYQVHLATLPSTAEQLQLWIPLATSDRNQVIRRRVIDAEVPFSITRDREYGNDILFVELKSPLPRELNLSIRYEADVRQGEYLKRSLLETQQRLGRGMGGGEGSQLYLASKRLMVVDAQVQELARRVTAGTQTPVEKAQAIYRYVIERMTYEKDTPGWGQGDTLRACDVGTGNCTDFHSLFISMVRASGIPARFRIGTPVLLQSEGEIPGYHCWAEFYVEGMGWVPVDASEAWKDRTRLAYFFGTYDPNRLAVSTGRDILPEPRPSKGPINIFFYPYAEVDGESFQGIQAKFRFRDLAKVGEQGGSDA